MFINLYSSDVFIRNKTIAIVKLKKSMIKKNLLLNANSHVLGYSRKTSNTVTKQLTNIIMKKDKINGILNFLHLDFNSSIESYYPESQFYYSDSLLLELSQICWF